MTNRSQLRAVRMKLIKVPIGRLAGPTASSGLENPDRARSGTARYCEAQRIGNVDRMERGEESGAGHTRKSPNLSRWDVERHPAASGGGGFPTSPRFPRLLVPMLCGCEKIEPEGLPIKMRRCRILVGTPTVPPVRSPMPNGKMRYIRLHLQCVRKP